MTSKTYLLPLDWDLETERHRELLETISPTCPSLPEAMNHLKVGIRLLNVWETVRTKYTGDLRGHYEVAFDARRGELLETCERMYIIATDLQVREAMGLLNEVETVRLSELLLEVWQTCWRIRFFVSTACSKSLLMDKDLMKVLLESIESHKALEERARAEKMYFTGRDKLRGTEVFSQAMMTKLKKEQTRAANKTASAQEKTTSDLKGKTK